MKDSYDIFISYRRKGGSEMAKLLRDLFVRDGLIVFFDEDANEIGSLGGILEECIRRSRIVVLVISKDCFNNIIDGKPSTDDNYWREIVCAVKEKGASGIIPVLTPDARSAKDLPAINDEFTLIKSLRYIRYDGNLSKLMGNFYDDLKECIANSQEHKKIGHNKWHTKKNLLIIILLLAVIIASIGAWWLNRPEEQTPNPIEDTYTRAKSMMDCEHSDSVKLGYHIMDSLSQMHYIPAMYEIVRTVGWNDNDTSIKRKTLLDITFDDNAPTDNKYNEIVVRLSETILAINDSAYAEINYNVALLLYYYYHESRFNMQDPERANQCLEKTRGWAEVQKDSHSNEQTTIASHR